MELILSMTVSKYSWDFTLKENIIKITAKSFTVIIGLKTLENILLWIYNCNCSPIKSPRIFVLENYTQAENAFKVFIGEHPKDSLTSNAYYWLGETYYVQKKFQLAAVSFAKGYQNFPKGNKAIDQLFKLALSFMNLGKNEDACAAFSKLESEFPNAPKRISNRAKEYIKRAKC